MIKHISIFCITLTLFVCTVNSQDFETICKVQSTTWNYIPQGYCDGFYTDSITILKDTIFNEQTYFVLYNDGYFESDTAGYLREDTIAGKLWYREDLLTAQEYLIMDLSLNKNDSFTLYDFSSSVEITVDTVYYDDENRKHVGFGDENMQLCSFTPDFEFIEGVGSTACHFYQGTVNGSILYSALLCCHKDDELIISNETFDNMCNILEVFVPEIQTDVSLNVFPNPSNGSFKIEFENPDSEFFSLSIYSLTGQTIYSQITYQELIQVNEVFDQEGIYFYKLTNHKDKIFSNKIIIEAENNVW